MRIAHVHHKAQPEVAVSFQDGLTSRCRLSKAGLQGQVCRDICVAAHFAPVGPWVMSGTAFLSVRVLMATG